MPQSSNDTENEPPAHTQGADTSTRTSVARAGGSELDSRRTFTTDLQGHSDAAQDHWRQLPDEFVDEVCWHLQSAQAALSLINMPTLGSRLVVYERCSKSNCGTGAGPRVVQESALASPTILGSFICGLKRIGHFKRHASSDYIGQPQLHSNGTCFFGEDRWISNCIKFKCKCKPCALHFSVVPTVNFIIHYRCNHHVDDRWWCFRHNGHSAVFEAYGCPRSTIIRRGRWQSQAVGAGTTAAAVFGHSLSAQTGFTTFDMVCLASALSM
jgi:hypothetical protein